MDVKQRTSGQIDGEMQDERQTIKQMQATLDKAKKERAKAEAAQDESAYDAIARGDERAQKKLDAAEEALTKADRRAQSIEKAITKATQKYQNLEDQWRAALRLEDLEKLKALVRKRIELAPRLDAVIKELLAVHADFNQVTQEMRVIRQGLGLNRLKLREDNLQEWLRARLYPTFGEFHITKTFEMYRERKSMVDLETVCFEVLLKMEDAPEGNGQGAANGEIQAAGPESEAGAEAGTAI